MVFHMDTSPLYYFHTMSLQEYSYEEFVRISEFM